MQNLIPGIYVIHPNQHVQELKQFPWPQLLALLGRSGEEIMIGLLLDCSIFLAIDAGRGNFYQLSGESACQCGLQRWPLNLCVLGYPIFDLEPVESRAKQLAPPSAGQTIERSPSEIVFARNRILYARAALNARGLVHFGLRHIRMLRPLPRPTG